MNLRIGIILCASLFSQTLFAADDVRQLSQDYAKSAATHYRECVENDGEITEWKERDPKFLSSVCSIGAYSIKVIIHYPESLLNRDLTEIVSRDGSIVGNINYAFADGKKGSDLTPITPAAEAKWQSSLKSLKTGKLLGKQLAGCNSGNKADCAAYLKTSGSKDLKVLSQSCKSGLDSACEAAASIEKQTAQKQKEEADAKASIAAADKAKADKLASPACRSAKAMGDYCTKQLQVRSLKLQVAHEERVGKESGYTNAVKIHKFVSARLIIEEQAEALAKEIGSLSGRSPATSDCQIQDESSLRAVSKYPAGDKIRSACTE